jgi:hypothetical protein
MDEDRIDRDDSDVTESLNANTGLVIATKWSKIGMMAKAGQNWGSECRECQRIDCSALRPSCTASPSPSRLINVARLKDELEAIQGAAPLMATFSDPFLCIRNMTLIIAPQDLPLTKKAAC